LVPDRILGRGERLRTGRAGGNARAPLLVRVRVPRMRMYALVEADEGRTLMSGFELSLTSRCGIFA